MLQMIVGLKRKYFIFIFLFLILQMMKKRLGLLQVLIQIYCFRDVYQFWLVAYLKAQLDGLKNERRYKENINKNI